MDLKSNHSSPVLTDPAPINKSRLGIHSNLLPYTQSGASFSTGDYISIPRKKPGKLDDVRSNGWLDAMISSSPPRKKLIKDFSIDVTSDDTDIAYFSWMVCACYILFSNYPFISIIGRMCYFVDLIRKD